MARKKQKSEAESTNAVGAFTPAKILSTTKMPSPSIPTDNPRHMSKIRFGTFSSENFCRNPARRKELGLPPIPTMESDFIDELRR